MRDHYHASNKNERLMVPMRARIEDTLFMAFQFKSGLVLLALATLGWTTLCLGQTPQPPAPGSISGTIVDQSGAVVTGARVKLTVETQSPIPEVLSGDNGQFSFADVAPGAFGLTITSAGFATQTSSGILGAAETQIVPRIVLMVAENVTDVQVALSRTEIAQEQIKDEEKQRVIGIIPNFYVTYDPQAVPLTSKQKFTLAFRMMVDPFTFLVVAGTAGAQQAQNHFIGYGQGAQGYAKRFGANYADNITGTFIGGAILPSLLKQDPRYFYKGTGSTQSRFLYAVKMSVTCKGDNGRWQPNYSNILGDLASGGLSNLYYPAADRNSADLTFENTAIGLGGNVITNLLQEFVARRFTPHVSHHNTAQP
jgi:hypothetical protein